MPEITITLDMAHFLGLQYWLELSNARRVQERDAQGQPLAPVTVEQFVAENLTREVENQTRNLSQETRELVTILRSLSTTARDEAIAQFPDGARKQWIEARIAQPEAGGR